MKRIGEKIAFTLLAGILAMGTVAAQDTRAQRDEEAARRAQAAADRASQRSEEAVRRAEEHQRHCRQEERSYGMRGCPGEMKFVTDSTGTFRVIICEDSTEVVRFRIPEMPEMPVIPEISDVYLDYQGPEFYQQYFHGGSFSNSKPGSSWNYSRRLAESTFTNDYAIAADSEASEVSLNVSGGCAEGSITIAIIAPDGSKLTEVLLDENGSMNWRKNFTLENGKWNKGNWVFKVNAKNATGHFNISLSAF